MIKYLLLLVKHSLLDYQKPDLKLLKKFPISYRNWRLCNEYVIRKLVVSRAVGRYENSGVPVLIGGHNLPPWV